MTTVWGTNAPYLPDTIYHIVMTLEPGGGPDNRIVARSALDDGDEIAATRGESRKVKRLRGTLLYLVAVN